MPDDSTPDPTKDSQPTSTTEAIKELDDDLADRLEVDPARDDVKG